MSFALAESPPPGLRDRRRVIDRKRPAGGMPSEPSLVNASGIC
jgi:hypothetical protein